ncbi:phosphoribosyltransferase [Phormidium tenue FACHB-886]|nr:phosphoribosyltransferase [Phormidium tenue FACHB-886]
MSDLHISWTDYHYKIEQLAVKIHESGWEFNQIICLARGGLRVGDLLSRIFDLPLAILATASYRGSGGRSRGNIVFSRDLTMTTPGLDSHVLLVDDLVDSGVSLQKSLAWLDRYYGFYIEEIRTGVLWYKSCSTIAPDYYIDYLADNPWIHQPFDTYEKTTIEEMAKAHAAGTTKPVST